MFLEMKTKLESTPSAVVDFTEIQTHLRLDGTADQTLVENLVSAVTKRVEQFIDRKLITQTWSIYLNCFPYKAARDSWWDGVRDGAITQIYSPVMHIDLPFGPCQSVSFLKTIDETDGTATYDASNYAVDTIGPRPKIALRRGSTWPSTTLRPVNGVFIQGVFGYGSASQVPEDIRQAIKLTVAKLYENRGDQREGEFLGVGGFTIPPTAQMLLQPYTTAKLRGDD